MNNYDALNGQVVVEVIIDNEEQVRVKFGNGRVATFGLDGDCCSRSYYTDPDQFKELLGSTIYQVEERYGSSSPEVELNADDGRDECTAWHFLVFTTSNGHVTIDWRNDSNGYYDGSVVYSIQ